MRIAIIGGTGFNRLPGIHFEPEIVATPYGQALVYRAVERSLFKPELELIFLSRHGVEHTIPPHRINYRANLKALAMLGVERILATFAVGSLRIDIPPLSLVALDQFLDFTQGREHTFYEGGKSGVVHVELTEPYCPALRERILSLAGDHGLVILPKATYACSNGPRLESAAEVRMMAMLGGDVVGMTGVPEVSLARELGIHYAAVAYSINYGAGLAGPITFDDSGKAERQKALVDLFIDALASPFRVPCTCQGHALVIHPPEK
ncbi:MAG TPA: S-methyl-5'-thioinosine phosphorylase [Anaerolineaceae bacterium]|nr:S-methyl-5'-thioinosine phosphorylase [Anaerolineaceae bacterium]